MRVTTPGGVVADRAQVESSRHRTSQRSESTGDPAGLLYGALIAASVLATASAHVEDFPSIALATAFVLGVYWLAHVYVAAQALHEGRRSFLRRLADVAGHEASLLKGGLPAIAVYVALDLLGVATQEAAAYAVYFSVAVLVYVGYLTALRSGRHGWASVIDAAAAGGFGLLVILAKTLLH